MARARNWRDAQARDRELALRREPSSWNPAPASRKQIAFWRSLWRELYPLEPFPSKPRTVADASAQIDALKREQQRRV